MDISGIGGIGNARPVTGAAGMNAANTDFAAILDNFRKVAFETPAERARDQVLKKHKLSEGEYQKLPQAERDAIDREIADAVKKVTEAKTGVPQANAPYSTEKLLG